MDGVLLRNSERTTSRVKGKAGLSPGWAVTDAPHASLNRVSFAHLTEKRRLVLRFFAVLCLLVRSSVSSGPIHVAFAGDFVSFSVFTWTLIFLLWKIPLHTGWGGGDYAASGSGKAGVPVSTDSGVRCGSRHNNTAHGVLGERQDDTRGLLRVPGQLRQEKPGDGAEGPGGPAMRGEPNARCCEGAARAPAGPPRSGSTMQDAHGVCSFAILLIFKYINEQILKVTWKCEGRQSKPQ